MKFVKTSIILLLLLFGKGLSFAGETGPDFEFFQFLNTEKLTKFDFAAEFGKAKNVNKKLGGWEYWYYDNVVFQETTLNFQKMGIPYMAFKNDRLVPPRELRKRQSSILKNLFLPVTIFCFFPWGSYLTIPLALLCSIGVFKLRGLTQKFLIYLLIGCFLIFLGIIF